MNSLPFLGIVADDLTGATTVGSLFARSQAQTAVILDDHILMCMDPSRNFDVVILSSNSRALSKENAYNANVYATGMLKQLGIQYFSKRIDTTLRGNIGAEIDAMMNIIGENVLAVVVPTMPQSKRIVVGGQSIIDGVPLIHTAVAQDIRTPVKENHIPTLLGSQTKHQVGLIEYSVVLKGPSNIAKELIAKRNIGCRIIVVDAVDMQDITAIALACTKLKWDILSVDPGPFTVKLAYYRGLIQEEMSDIPENASDGQKKTVLIVVGSTTPITIQQVATFCNDKRHIRISLNPANLIETGEICKTEILNATNRALSLLEEKEPPRVILFETISHGPILNLQAEDEKHGHPLGRSADMITLYLGIIAQKIIEAAEDQIAGIYCTGGETAESVCHALEASYLKMIDYVDAQIDVGLLIGKNKKIPFVGKGGLVGSNTVIYKIVDRLLDEAARYQ